MRKSRVEVVAAATVRYPHREVRVRIERAPGGAFTVVEEDDSRANAARVRFVGEPAGYATEQAVREAFLRCVAEHEALSVEDDDDA